MVRIKKKKQPSTNLTLQGILIDVEYTQGWEKTDSSAEFCCDVMLDQNGYFVPETKPL